MTAFVLWANRWPEMLDFYRDLFSMEIREQPEGFAYLVGAHNEVLLHAVPAEYRSDGTGSAEARTEAPIKPIFTVGSLEQLIDLGLKIGADPSEFAGWKYFDLIDPDGNVLTIRAKA